MYIFNFLIFDFRLLALQVKTLVNKCYTYRKDFSIAHFAFFNWTAQINLSVTPFLLPLKKKKSKSKIQKIKEGSSLAVHCPPPLKSLITNEIFKKSSSLGFSISYNSQLTFGASVKGKFIDWHAIQGFQHHGKFKEFRNVSLEVFLGGGGRMAWNSS